MQQGFRQTREEERSPLADLMLSADAARVFGMTPATISAYERSGRLLAVGRGAVRESREGAAIAGWLGVVNK